jgi:hypothetical protein
MGRQLIAASVRALFRNMRLLREARTGRHLTSRRRVSTRLEGVKRCPSIFELRILRRASAGPCGPPKKSEHPNDALTDVAIDCRPIRALSAIKQFFVLHTNCVLMGVAYPRMAAQKHSKEWPGYLNIKFGTFHPVNVCPSYHLTSRARLATRPAARFSRRPNPPAPG